MDSCCHLFKRNDATLFLPCQWCFCFFVFLAGTFLEFVFWVLSAYSQKFFSGSPGVKILDTSEIFLAMFEKKKPKKGQGSVVWYSRALLGDKEGDGNFWTLLGPILRPTLSCRQGPRLKGKTWLEDWFLQIRQFPRKSAICYRLLRKSATPNFLAFWRLHLLQKRVA